MKLTIIKKKYVLNFQNYGHFAEKSRGKFTPARKFTPRLPRRLATFWMWEKMSGKNGKFYHKNWKICIFAAFAARFLPL